MKKYLAVSIAAFAILAITLRAFCYEADVTNISGAKYFPAAKEALEKAKSSIFLVMFTMESSAQKKDSKPNQLIEALISAKKRGVSIEVILEQNADLFLRKQTGGREAQAKIANAYKRLKDAGIKVYYDEPAKYTRAKGIVIDNKIVILGSNNWAEGSFDKNIGTNVLIRSERLANEILNYLKVVKISKEKSPGNRPHNPKKKAAQKK